MGPLDAPPPAPPPAERSPADELRLLVRRARMLLATEREGGVVDLPGTPAPAPDPVPESPATSMLTVSPGRASAGAETTPARQRAAPALPDTTAASIATPSAEPRDRHREDARAEPIDVRVRALDLPPDALAPFGSLPEQVASCHLCGLCEGRTHTVFGEGSASARLVFCGEGPGAEEDASGRPFVGKSGELLTAMIEKGLKLRREEVFILNTVKCRPPRNRTPSPEEIAACRPYLERQLAVIRPVVIVALGNPACKALLGNVPGIMTIRGRVFDAWNAKVIPTFHPAYLLRNPDAKRATWEDLKLVLKLLADAQ